MPVTGDETTPSTPSYPPHWEADVVASDGGTVRLRPITPGDADALVGMHARTSDRSRYLRFFGAYPRIPERDLRRFTHVDHADRVALVVYLAEELVAVGRYDRVAGTDSAEVAFLVEDAHQGRGLGTVLLEHLAAAARERGIRRFVADVLAENTRMVRVFREAGFSADSSYADGVTRLEFEITPTETSVAVGFEREQRAEARSLGRLLTAGSVAVVADSVDEGTRGRAVLDNLRAYGPAGDVHLVQLGAAGGRDASAYARVDELPGNVDLAAVAVPADRLGEVVEQCGHQGVRGLLVLANGADAALVSAARAHGMRVVGPQCLGVLNTDPAVRLNATLSPEVPSRGRVGCFCQSGALGVVILHSARTRGLGMSTFVSAGDRADVSGNDLLQYWESDPATEVVLLHLESFGNPRKFARLARRLGRRKPVVVVKSGRHAGVPDAQRARAADLTEESVQALFASAGVIRVDTSAQMFDVAMVLAHQPPPSGRRVAVVGNSAALGLLVVDACLANGLQVPRPTVDVGVEGTPEDFAAALTAALDDADVDAVVAVFVPVLPTDSGPYAEALERATAAAVGREKPVVSTFLGIEGVPEGLRRPDESGEVGRGSVPSYPSPERAALALARAGRYAEWRRRPPGAIPDLDRLDPAAARAVVSGVLSERPGGRQLSDDEAGNVLSAYGIEVLPSRLARDADEAVAQADALGYPVVLKSPDPTVRRRVDSGVLGGMRLDLPDASAVAAAYAAITTGSGEVVVQPTAAAGLAVQVEVRDDPSFGALVGFAVAGVVGDLLGDRAYRPLPLTDRDAADLVREPRAYPLLTGHRAAQPVDVAAVEDLLLRVARLADDVPELLGLGLDPVIVAPTGAAVAAATATVGPPTSRLGPQPRRLATPR